MPDSLNIVLAAVLMLASAIWIGGYVAAAVVARVTFATLDASMRVRFFRRFGKVHAAVTTPALLVAYAVGWVFLSRLPWSGEVTLIAIAEIVLLVALLAGVMQARDLRMLRERLHSGTGDDGLDRSIRRRARAAGILRALIGLLTLVIVVEAAILLTAQLS